MAEAWMKATTKWQALHERPLRIEIEQAVSESPLEKMQVPIFTANQVNAVPAK
jgi:hypothetical protein